MKARMMLELKATRWVVGFDIPSITAAEADGAPIDAKLVFALLTVMTGGLTAGAGRRIRWTS